MPDVLKDLKITKLSDRNYLNFSELKTLLQENS